MTDSLIFDDFDEPAAMSKAFCTQVSAKEYSDYVASETDKALGELCLLLDKEPELYARVLRKRKREEIESDGVFSMMKSKVLGLVQGDDYTTSLVSDGDCMRHTNALKAGICRTFQYAQEIKNEPVRRSQRQVSKLATQADKSNSYTKRAGDKSRTNAKKAVDLTNKIKETNGIDKTSHRDCGDGQQESYMHLLRTQKPTITSSKDDNNNGEIGDTFEDISLSSDNGNNVDGPPDECNCIGGVDQKMDDNDHGSESVSADKSKSVPPPPPGPPPLLPAHLTSDIFHDSTPTVNKLADSFVSPSQTTSYPDAQHSHSSRDTVNGSSSVESLPQPTNGIACIQQSKSDVVITDVTPDDGVMGRRLRSRRHIGSTLSLSSVHSELTASNPVSRLKVTQIVRSPGGTPLRPTPSSRLPSEPLHKALVTAVRSKFKNVHTPSPRSAFSSANNSGAFSFSP